jgi:hypothetical protein
MFSQMVTSADLPGRAAAGPASPPAAGDAIGAGFLDRGGAGLKDGAQLVAFLLGVGALAVQLGAQLVPLAGGVGGPARAAIRRRRGPGRSRPGRRSRPTVPGWLPALASPARTCSAKSSSSGSATMR